jgi:hypothetical protein
MTTIRLVGLALALASAFGAAQAQDGLSRDQVRAETHAAQLAGEIPHGDLDATARHPQGDVLPAADGVSTLTRAQVRAETLQAIRDGDIPMSETGMTPAQQFPQRYAAARVRDGEPRYAMAN